MDLLPKTIEQFHPEGGFELTNLHGNQRPPYVEGGRGFGDTALIDDPQEDLEKVKRRNRGHK